MSPNDRIIKIKYTEYRDAVKSDAALGQGNRKTASWDDDFLASLIAV
jgi:hypothetical protein